MSARPSLPIAVLAATLAHAGAAAAQEARVLQVAAEPPKVQAAAEPRRERVDFAMINLDAGTAIIASRNPGGYGRFGSAYLSARDADRPSFAWGFWGGWEAFRVGGAWGLGLPLVVSAGVKSPKVHAALGAGVNVFQIGELDKKFGGGLFQPRAQARLGLHAGKVLFSGTFDVQYGWGWGHPAQVVLMTGVSAGIVLDEQRKLR